MWCECFQSWWVLLLWIRGIEDTWASITVAHGLQNAGSVVLAHRLTCSAACWILVPSRDRIHLLCIAGRFLTTGPPGVSLPHLKKKNYLFLNILLCWIFIALHGLSLATVRGGYSLLPCTGLSLWWLLPLWSTSSRCTGFSSGGR